MHARSTHHNTHEGRDTSRLSMRAARRLRDKCIKDSASSSMKKLPNENTHDAGPGMLGSGAKTSSLQRSATIATRLVRAQCAMMTDQPVRLKAVICFLEPL